MYCSIWCKAWCLLACNELTVSYPYLTTQCVVMKSLGCCLILDHLESFRVSEVFALIFKGVEVNNVIEANVSD